MLVTNYLLKVVVDQMFCVLLFSLSASPCLRKERFEMTEKGGAKVTMYNAPSFVVLTNGTVIILGNKMKQ